MNWCATFLLTLAIGGFQPSNGLDINLCIGLFGNCNSGQNNPSQPNQSAGGVPMNPSSLLTNGFMEFNLTAAMSKNLAMSGLKQASTMAASHPNTALKMINDSIQDCQHTFFKSGTYVLLSLGQALTHSGQFASRDDLVKEFQDIQYIALSLLDTLRTSVSLAFQGFGFGHGASNQVIEAVEENINSIYGALFNQIPIALQGTVKALTLPRSLATYEMSENNNNNAIASDTDAQNAIAELNQATKDAIQKGASSSKAEKFRNLITNLLGDFAVIASYNKNNIDNFQNTANYDPTLAKNTYIDRAAEVKSRIQKLFTNICLEYGSIDDKLTQDQIEDAFVSVEHGNDEVDYANKITQDIVVGSIKYDTHIREVMINAAADVMKYGKVSFYERTVEGAKLILQALARL